MSSTDLVAVVRVQFNDEWIVRFHVRSLTLLLLSTVLLACSLACLVLPSMTALVPRLT